MKNKKEDNFVRFICLLSLLVAGIVFFGSIIIFFVNVYKDYGSEGGNVFVVILAALSMFGYWLPFLIIPAVLSGISMAIVLYAGLFSNEAIKWIRRKLKNSKTIKMFYEKASFKVICISSFVVLIGYIVWALLYVSF